MGAHPGTMSPFEAEIMPMVPSIARRPLLISATRAFSLRSGVIFLVKPKGSHRSSGTCPEVVRRYTSFGGHYIGAIFADMIRQELPGGAVPSAP